MRLILILFFLIPTIHMAQHRLDISVRGVTSSEGHINIAIYNESDGFLKLDSAFKTDSTKAKKGVTQLTIGDLPPGTYAIALFHDKNANAILDTNWLGIPKEDVAFSKAKMKAFGPPCFEDCSFTLLRDGTLEILF